MIIRRFFASSPPSSSSSSSLGVGGTTTRLSVQRGAASRHFLSKCCCCCSSVELTRLQRSINTTSFGSSTRRCYSSTTAAASASKDSNGINNNDRHARYVIVGLGNPGIQFDHTRHNIGFAMVDHLLDSWITRTRRSSMKQHEYSDAVVHELELSFPVEESSCASTSPQQVGETPTTTTTRMKEMTISLVKPQTFMNLSGNAVSRLMKKWRIPHHSLLVIYDDIDLPVGAVKMKSKGSGAGQKGMEHIIKCLAKDNIPRLRIGVGPRPRRGEETAEYVLSKFRSEERRRLDSIREVVRVGVETWLQKGIQHAMNYANKAASVKDVLSNKEEEDD
eukprot:TRINITY_DN1628_c0_g3_i1.p1 TRINITY_DN1628_c0_g3~~TRINITY_DN1628_c0_g3_i1.p1  ORF type:complete len:334 (+),score=81.96 TRINITY_DN1628_c0_g3_i1:109-1110(+)